MTRDFDSLRVLVVDDDDGVRTICALALTRLENWTIFLSDGCETALQVLAEHEIDLVLLDVMMPKIDGLETLRRIRANADTAHVPVIFLTAKVDLPNLLNGITPSQGVISKPFDPVELGRLIRELLVDDRRRNLHEKVD